MKLSDSERIQPSRLVHYWKDIKMAAVGDIDARHGVATPDNESYAEFRARIADKYSKSAPAFAELIKSAADTDSIVNLLRWFRSPNEILRTARIIAEVKSWEQRQVE